MDPASERLLSMLRRLSLRQGDFVLASGERASAYVDCRQTTLTSAGHALCGKLLLHRIRRAERAGAGPFVAVGGMALGAAPLASAVSILSQGAPPTLDAFLVRKEQKGHGTASQVEGMASRHQGDRVVLVEDVVTSGGSVLRAIDLAEAAGLWVGLVLALVDRGAGGADQILARGKPFEALFTLDQIVEKSE